VVLKEMIMGMDVNFSFTSVSDFAMTREVALFTLAEVDLVHQWLADPLNFALREALLASSPFYDDVVALIAARDAKRPTAPVAAAVPAPGAHAAPATVSTSAATAVPASASASSASAPLVSLDLATTPVKDAAPARTPAAAAAVAPDASGSSPRRAVDVNANSAISPRASETPVTTAALTNARDVDTQLPEAVRETESCAFVRF
jgi:hypothetical protein